MSFVDVYCPIVHFFITQRYAFLTDILSKLPTIQGHIRTMFTIVPSRPDHLFGVILLMVLAYYGLLSIWTRWGTLLYLCLSEDGEEWWGGFRVGGGVALLCLL